MDDELSCKPETQEPHKYKEYFTATRAKGKRHTTRLRYHHHQLLLHRGASSREAYNAVHEDQRIFCIVDSHCRRSSRVWVLLAGKKCGEVPAGTLLACCLCCVCCVGIANTSRLVSELMPDDFAGVIWRGP